MKISLNSLKTIIKILFSRITFLKKEIDIRHDWYGSSYGGFYVNPEVLDKNSIVYSFGIGEDISFDRQIIDTHNCRVFAFDPTPKSIDWLKNQPLPQGFTFMPYGINSRTGTVNFLLPKNKEYVSGSIVGHDNVDPHDVVAVPMKSFDDIVAELGHTHIDLLKIDIEGTEYDVIEGILATPVAISQIVLELHERFFSNGKSKTKDLLKSLKNHGYTLFAVSDTMEELSFIKKKV